MKPDLTFLKLGGSLITNKDLPHTARRRLIRRLAGEISQALSSRPEMDLILGHGSGSFGHIPAARHGTRGGVKTREDWQGFVEVWREARALNLIVVEECMKAGLPVVSFPPSVTHISHGQRGVNTSLPAIKTALEAGLIPVVYGDVIFDTKIGGTIFSTEEIFAILVNDLHPARILLAGYENGVYLDFHHRRHVLAEITPQSHRLEQDAAGASASIDVTGGMKKKVNIMVELVSKHPELSVQIFSGRRHGMVLQTLLGSLNGTRICSYQPKEGRS